MALHSLGVISLDLPVIIAMGEIWGDGVHMGGFVFSIKKRGGGVRKNGGS